MPASRCRDVLANISLIAALGCGAASPAPPATTVSVTPPTSPLLATLPGNWSMQNQINVSAPLSAATFNGALAVQDSAVSGTFRLASFITLVPITTPSTGIVASSCVPSTQDIPFTGDVDSTNLLTLTSAPFSGSVAVLTLQLPLNALGVASGTVTISGGSCALPTSTLLGISVPPVTGTYTGSIALNPAPGQPTNPGDPATLTLTQSSANADGQFPVSGTLSFASPGCNLSIDLGGVVTGLTANLHQTLPDGSSPVPVPSQVAAVIYRTNIPTLTFLVPAGNLTCAAGSYSGQLTRQ